ncbi:MAG: I78 family peptidase inhibitor [Pseudomonadota bacterium]
MKDVTLMVMAMSGLALAASATAQETPAMCQTEPGQAFVGGPASAETGAQIQAATGARTFQWVFENSPVTMDYRPGRVRVVYDRAMTVVAVTCG